MLSKLRKVFCWDPHIFLRCPVCGGPKGREPLCERCLELLKIIDGGYCPLCGRIYHGTQDVFLCGDCLVRPREWDWFGFFGAYKGVLRDMIMDFKYRGDFSVLGCLQRLLYLAYLKHSVDWVPDLVIPVPIHQNRLKTRGFNQALEIGRLLSRRIKKTIKKDVLIRIRDTRPQVGLTGHMRKQNVRHAFSVLSELHGEKVLLIDDVYTTGATIFECVKELKKTGAGSIGVLVVARSQQSIFI